MSGCLPKQAVSRFATVMDADDIRTEVTPDQPSDQPFRVSLATSVAGVLGAATFLGALVLFVIWIAVGRPKLDQPDTLSLGTAMDGLKLAGGLVVGVGGAVALVVAYRRQRLGEESHRRQEEAAQRDRARLYNERFARASGQLGSDRPAIRLAGIYALAGLADDWQDGRQACIDVLCAYLRMPFRPQGSLPEFESPTHRRPRAWEILVNSADVANVQVLDMAGETQVRASVIEVLHLRLWSGARTSWFGARLDFTGAVFEEVSFDAFDFSDCSVCFDDCLFLGDCGFSETTWCRTDASFLGAVFAGRLGFEYSTFEDSEVILYGDFTKAADLNFQGLTLKSGKLDLLGPRAHGGSVSFVAGVLSGGELTLHPSILDEGASIAFSRCVMSGTDVKIEGGEYTSGNIWCNGVDLQGGSFTIGAVHYARNPVELSGVELSFDGARITGGVIALRGVRICGSDVHFDDLEMTGGHMDFSKCELTSGALRFADAKITGGKVSMADPAGSGPMNAAARSLQEAGARILYGSAGEESGV